MSTMMERLRKRRAINRRHRVISRVMREAPTAAMRNELLEIVSRYE
jgi:hypothetical protein